MKEMYQGNPSIGCHNSMDYLYQQGRPSEALGAFGLFFPELTITSGWVVLADNLRRLGSPGIESYETCKAGEKVDAVQNILLPYTSVDLNQVLYAQGFSLEPEYINCLGNQLVKAWGANLCKSFPKRKFFLAFSSAIDTVEPAVLSFKESI
jgi:hypothetical protein